MLRAIFHIPSDLDPYHTVSLLQSIHKRRPRERSVREGEVWKCLITVKSHERHGISIHHQLDCLLNSLLSNIKDIKDSHCWPLMWEIHWIPHLFYCVLGLVISCPLFLGILKLVSLWLNYTSASIPTARFLSADWWSDHMETLSTLLILHPPPTPNPDPHHHPQPHPTPPPPTTMQKASGAYLLCFFVISWIGSWTKNLVAGDLESTVSVYTVMVVIVIINLVAVVVVADRVFPRRTLYTRWWQ